MATTKEFNISSNAVTVLNQTTAAAENTAKGFTSAKAELRALQNQMLEMDQTSAEFKKASARAAELKDNISDLSAEINANAGNAFEGLSNNVGLFGSRLMDLDLAGAGQALKGVGVAVSKIDFKTIQKEIGGLINGFASLGKAIISNPILLLAGAVALVVANFDSLIKLFPSVEKGLTGISEQERNLLSLQTQRAEQAKKNYDKISATENVLRLQGKTEKEIRDLKIAALKTAIEEAQVRRVTARNQAISQVETAKRNRKILEGIITFIEAPLFLILSAVDGIAALVGKTSNLAGGLVDFQAKLLIDPEEQSAELQKSLDEQEAAITEMKNNLAGLQLEQKKADADAAKARKDLEKQQAKDRQDRLKQEQDDKERLQKEADDKELERRKKLNDEMMAEDDHMASIELTDLIEREKKKGDAKILAEMQSHANLTNLKKEHTQEELEELQKAEEAKAQLRVDAMKTSLSIISDLAGAFAGESEAQQKKAFNIQKGVSIATATIDTYLAAQGAYRSQMAISTPDAPVRAAVAAGIAIAQGLARVAIISKQQFKGGGSTSGGSGSGGGVPNASGMEAPSPANFAFLGNQPNQQQPPLQAYVVSGQVSSNLEAQQLINNQARLGG